MQTFNLSIKLLKFNLHKQLLNGVKSRVCFMVLQKEHNFISGCYQWLKLSVARKREYIDQKQINFA